MIRLEKVNGRTFRKVVDMKLSPEQNKYVAPNIVSLAQAWLSYEEARPLAICDGDTVVGFIMLDWDEGERTAGIWRFMIATEQQHKGYGRQALEAALQMIRDAGCFDMAYLDYVPGNTIARELYYSLGFRENGEVDEEDGEIVMTLPLTDHPKVGMLTADDEDTDDFIELIDAEKALGTAIPDALTDREQLAQAVEAKRVKRLTLMGKTIGLAIDGAMLLGHAHHAYRAEAEARLENH